MERIDLMGSASSRSAPPWARSGCDRTLVYGRPSDLDGFAPEEISSVGFVVVSPGYFAGVRMEFVEIAPIEEVRNGFWIDGSLDMITAPDVRRFMEDVPPGPLVLDLARVKFLDTVGLYLLLRLSERSEESPSLIIRNPSQAVRRVLRICHPDGIPYVEVQSAGTDTVAGAATAGLA